jgi:hypothetical protein
MTCTLPPAAADSLLVGRGAEEPSRGGRGRSDADLWSIQRERETPPFGKKARECEDERVAAARQSGRAGVGRLVQTAERLLI